MKKYQRDAVVGIERENERDETYRSKSNPQIDCERTPHNYHFIKPDDTYTAFINQRIKDLAPKRKIKDDAVLMCSFFVGASPEFFIGKDRDNIGAFFFECTEFFAERYGRENIISAVVHLDETTPHMHLNLIPITEDRLSAKRLFTRKSLRELQTDFWEKVGKKWNLERGKPGSQVTHKSVAEYKAQKILESARNEAKNIISEADGKAQAAKLQADSIVSQAEQTAAETKQQAQEYLNGVIQSVEEEKTKPTPKKRKQAEEEIRVLRAENAALRQAKDISDHDRADLFELYQESERANKSKESVYKMVSDILSAYPDEFRTLLHKSREKKTTPYYKENSHGYDRGGK